MEIKRALTVAVNALYRAAQDVRHRATACYVALETDRTRCGLLHTLAAGGIPLADMPEDIGKRLPRYPSVPVARLGRLAVDVDFQGQRLDGALLDAAMRALRSEVAVFALVVDTKDDPAEAFDRHHGFAAFGSLPRELIFPLTNLAFIDQVSNASQGLFIKTACEQVQTMFLFQAA